MCKFYWAALYSRPIYLYTGDRWEVGLSWLHYVALYSVMDGKLMSLYFVIELQIEVHHTVSPRYIQGGPEK